MKTVMAIIICTLALAGYTIGSVFFSRYYNFNSKEDGALVAVGLLLLGCVLAVIGIVINQDKDLK